MVCGLFKRNINTLLPKKVPKQKTPPLPRKWVICDYLLQNYITVKNVKFHIRQQQKRLALCERSQKTAYKTLKQFFFIFQTVFGLIMFICEH